MKKQIKYFSGQPCKHEGCLQHISHPCEGCGRKTGVGNVYYYAFDDLYKDLNLLHESSKA